MRHPKPKHNRSHLLLKPSKGSEIYEKSEICELGEITNNLALEPTRKQNGLTLVELLVAMVIMAVVSVGSYSLFELVQTARERLGAHSTKLSGVQRGLNWLSRDISAAIGRPIRDQFGTVQSAMIGSNSQIEFTRNSIIALDLNRFLEESDDRLKENSSRKSELLRVLYQAEGDNLVRTYWPSLDRSDSDEVFTSEIMGNLSQLEFRYFSKSEQTGGRWYTSWPPESLDGLVAVDDDASSEEDAEERKQRRLPEVIEINLETKSYGKITRLIELSSVELSSDQLEAGQSPDQNPDEDNEDVNGGGPGDEGDFDDDELDEDEDFG